MIFGHRKAVPIPEHPSAALSLAVPAACALGLALFVCVLAPLSTYNIDDHAFRAPAAAVLLAAAASMGFVFIARKFLLGSEPGGLVVLFPLAALIVSPLLLSSYLTRGDLATRLMLLGGFVLAAVAYLERARRKAGGTPGPAGTVGLLRRFEAAPRRARLLLLFGAAFLFYCACSRILVSEDVAFAGDEPTYLLTAHSILQDGDINIADDYDDREYVRFYEMENNPLMRFDLHAHRGRKGPDFAYPVNMPGISVAMLPFVWLSGFLKVKAAIFVIRASFSIWAALLGIQIYLLALGLWNDRRTALRLWAVYAFTAPVLFYAVHLYPEIPVAFFSVFVFRKIISPAPLSARQSVLCGLTLSLFPWFGLKFVALLWPLVAVAAYLMFKAGKNARNFLLLAGFPVLSQALYLTYPIRYRIESFLDYFFDQRDGLLLYSPLYAFSFLGLVQAFRKRRRDFFLLIAAALPYIAAHALFSQRQGYCPQGRNLTAVSWVLILLVGAFCFSTRPFFTSRRPPASRRGPAISSST
jgi:hypothetical protein